MLADMAHNWDSYTRQGIDLAHSASTLGFSAAKLGTRLGFSVARKVTTSAANLTTSAVDLFLFGGAPTSQPAVSSALTAAFTIAESLTLAPIHFTEYLTSTSLLAAHSSINVLSVIFPGSSDASFSLASFIGLVRREWATPREGDNWPAGDFGLTEIGRAIVAWVALQGVTQEWQEKQWFRWLKELDVNPQAPKRPELGPRRNSRIRVTSDVIFPGQGGAQIVQAVIGEAPPRLNRSQSFIHQKHHQSPPPQPPPAPSASWGRRSSISLLARRSLQPITPLSVTPLPQPSIEVSATPSPTASVIHPSGPPPPLSGDELKSTLRRLSKMVLAGYGGASLLFFGVSPYATPSPPKATGSMSDAQKSREEAQLTKAIDASEAEAAGDASESSTGSMPPYSWWDVLLGKHDKAIFEHWADHHPPTPAELQAKEKQRKEQMKAKMKATAVVGKEHLMPRFWVLTDYNRSQIVLVLRGTMSLNEIAVDLTCEPVTFTPVRTPAPSEEDENPVPGRFYFPTASASASEKGKGKQKEETGPRYHVHGGMLRMANAMGALGKPVHLAVQEALHNNPDFELILCGHSLGAGVAALLGMMWADPATCLTVPSSGLPPNRRVHVYCFGPPCLTDARLTRLTSHLITSFVYSHDIISRLSLGTVRDLKNAAMWLCEAQKHDEDKSSGAGKGEGYAALTARAKRWKAGQGSKDDVDWFIAMRKTLEANMHNMSIMMYPPGRVFWGMRNGDLHPSHRTPTEPGKMEDDKLRLFEVLDPEKIFGEIVFARNMLTAHMPTQYDKVLHDLL